jgi:anthranilate phosphoribosyltransferase
MDDFPQVLRSLLAGQDLGAGAAARLIGAIMDETLSPVRSAAFLAALAAKGETADEVIGAALAMRERSVRVVHDLALVIDVCGTGGDGAQTLNISTAAALVVAGAGVAVAKHGNRAASSACGSADVLEALGVKLERSAEASARLLRSANMAFLFAQFHHPAMRAVGPIRRELGVRTIFNLLGPLTNPASATRQVVGVAVEAQVELVATALRGLGTVAAAVVRAENGMDEVAGDAPTRIVQFDRNGLRRWTLVPADYGICASLSDLRGGDAPSNARALSAILDGEQSARTDVVALNSALALVVAGEAVDIRDGLARARRSIASGAARGALDALRAAHEMEYA